MEKVVQSWREKVHNLENTVEGLKDVNVKQVEELVEAAGPSRKCLIHQEGSI